MGWLPSHSKALSGVYIVFAILLSGLVIWRLPPFMGPDEAAHFRRANMTLFGEIAGFRVATPKGVQAGGLCEPSVEAARSCFEGVAGRPGAKPQPPLWKKAEAMPWGSGAVPVPSPNTAGYPPFLYLPQTLAILLGKALGIKVLATLTLARWANAIACMALGASAVYAAGKSAPYWFVLLLLPMPVQLMTACSQDGMTLALVSLSGAILTRAIHEGRLLTKRETLLSVVCLGLAAMTKPPYILLVLFSLVVPSQSPKLRALLVWASVLLTALWTAAATLYVQTPFIRPGLTLDPSLQTAFIIHHPLSFLSSMASSLCSEWYGYGTQMIGALGAMDVPMPKWYFLAACLTLGAAVAWESASGTAFDWKRVAQCLALASLTVIFIFAALYVTWTAVGAGRVSGIQGRYFLPLAALLPVAAARGGDSGRDRFLRFLAPFLFLLPPLSFYVIERALAARYY